MANNPPVVRTIKFNGVNCYLVSAGDGYVLIDTGYAKNRPAIDRELETAGCRPGNLKLIILTHGDYDHAGNAAYLRNEYRARVAMHGDESGAVEQGNMLLSRKEFSFFKRLIGRIFIFFLTFGRFDKFKPDLYFDDNTDLSAYGFDARAIHIPGHSRGSLGILTAGGDFFCGDLLVGGEKPALNSLIDDSKAAGASVERLKRLRINKVYPGHGRPFTMDQLPPAGRAK